MLSHENIVCFSVTDYGHDLPVGKDHLMEIFAKNGNKVLMVNLVGTRSPQATKYDILKILRKIREWFSGYKIINGIYVINPFRIPFIKYKFVNKVNEIILELYLKYYFRKFHISKPIFWVLNVLYADLLKKMDKKALIYYVSDDYAYFSGNNSQVFNDYEKRMLFYSDGVITVHRKLYERMSKTHKNVINILNSTNPYQFLNCKSKDIPEDLKKIKKPIVGYCGKIEDWIDIDLIKECAMRYPDYSFVLIGPAKVNTEILKNIPNIYLLGRKSYNEVPIYLNNFDICVSPFVKNKVTESMDFPLKIVEYFATGKPVVSINTNSPEKYIDSFQLCYTREDFVREVGLALQKDNKQLRERRRQIALENSWEKRAEELSDWIKKTIIDS